MTSCGASLLAALFVLLSGETPLELPTQILVRNHIGEPAVVFLDSARLLDVAPGGAARFAITPGAHKIAAECPSTGYTEVKTLDVPKGGLTELSFGPQGGRLLIANLTGQTLDLFRNGKPLSSIKAGVTVEYGGQPLGRSLVEALSPSRRVVFRKSVDVATLAEGRGEIAVVSTLVTAVVVNGTGEPVKVAPDGVAESRVIGPGEEAAVLVEGLDAVLKLRGEITGTRYDKLVEGAPGDTVRIALDRVAASLPADFLVGAKRLDAVVEPLVEVRNQTSGEIEIFLDSASVGSLGAGESRKVSTGTSGIHTLSARNPDATREWLLKETWFDEGREFGWTLTE